MILEVGKVYKVTHSRKGSFVVCVTSQCDTWTTGVIVEGETQAMLPYNKRFEGEDITFRSEWTRSADEVHQAN